jgi:hypothetical protein
MGVCAVLVHAILVIALKELNADLALVRSLVSVSITALFTHAFAVVFFGVRAMCATSKRGSANSDSRPLIALSESQPQEP